MMSYLPTNLSTSPKPNWLALVSGIIQGNSYGSRLHGAPPNSSGTKMNSTGVFVSLFICYATHLNSSAKDVLLLPLNFIELKSPARWSLTS